MKRGRDRRHLSLITEISVTPLLSLFFVLLLILMAAAPLLNPTVGGGLVPPESPPKVLAPPAVRPPPPAPPVAIDAPASAPVFFGRSKFAVTLSQNTRRPSVPAVDMTGVDQAVIAAFKQNWVLPAGLDMGGVPREADMDVVIARDGRIITYMLVKPSGHAQVDMAALRAAGLVKQIATPLPAQFSGDSHEVQLHFRAE